MYNIKKLKDKFFTTVSESFFRSFTMYYAPIRYIIKYITSHLNRDKKENLQKNFSPPDEKLQAILALERNSRDLSFLEENLSELHHALSHYRFSDDFHGQAETLRQLGHAAKNREHLEESRKFYLESVRFFRKVSDHYAEAAVLLDLGQVYENLEEMENAAEAYRNANRALATYGAEVSNREKKKTTLMDTD